MILKLAKKVFSTTVDIFLPACLFAFCTFFYCDKAISADMQSVFFHTMFYVLFVIWMFYIFFCKRSRDGILSLFLVFCYIGLNVLKQKYAIAFDKTVQYQLIGVTILCNWLVYVVMDFFKVSKQYDFYFLCFLLFQACLIENANEFFVENFGTDFDIGVILCWLVGILVYIVYVSVYPNIKNYGAFFSFLCAGLGFFNSESAFGLSLYFSFAVLILFVSTVYLDIYRYFRDLLTGVYSSQSYLRHSKNFPLKYSLGIICIDDYEKLLKIFGENQVNILVKLIMKIILSTSYGAEIYRYGEDEFILIFKNEDKKQCFEYLEEIRRSIAGSEFVLNSKRIVKITVSAGVSEKKRSDADADTVLMRTREAVQRTYKFTQNMTSKA